MNIISAAIKSLLTHKTYKAKIKYGKYNKATGKFTRGKRPGLNPVRKHNADMLNYRARQAWGKQWIKEMKFGGAKYA